MPKAERWHQYSFVAPMHTDIGIIPHKPKIRRMNSDTGAVFAFIRRERAAIYEQGKQPALSALTAKQRRMYKAIKISDAVKTEKWLAGIGEKSYIPAEKIVLDQPVKLEAVCFDCGSNLLMEIILLTRGTSESLLQQEVWCPSCGNPEPKQIKKANHLIQWK
jgi:hypothetical protein